jgi:hypothetical protein
MISLSKLASGALLIQKDATEIVIDAPAIRETLPILIAVLIDSSKALAAARQAGYEDGLAQGYANAQIASATSARIAERQASELVESLIGCAVASAA